MLVQRGLRGLFNLGVGLGLVWPTQARNVPDIFGFRSVEMFELIFAEFLVQIIIGSNKHCAAKHYGRPPSPDLLPFVSSKLIDFHPGLYSRRARDHDEPYNNPPLRIYNACQMEKTENCLSGSQDGFYSIVLSSSVRISLLWFSSQ